MTTLSKQTPVEAVELSVALKTVCFLIMKAREFDAKDVASDESPGSNSSDDNSLSVLEDRKDDSVLEEMKSLISELSVDEQVDLVALTWLGRAEAPESWADMRAAALAAHNNHTADYLCGNPLLADHLSDGLSAIGLSCGEYEAQHL